MTKISEILNKAADEIERRGWTSGQGWVRAGEADSELCLEGGIMAALGVELPEKWHGVGKVGDELLTELWSCPAYAAVQEYLGLGSDRCLWGWNDHVARNPRTVIETLRAAAAVEAVKEAERETASVS